MINLSKRIFILIFKIAFSTLEEKVKRKTMQNLHILISKKVVSIPFNLRQKIYQYLLFSEHWAPTHLNYYNPDCLRWEKKRGGQWNKQTKTIKQMKQNQTKRRTVNKQTKIPSEAFAAIMGSGVKVFRAGSKMQLVSNIFNISRIIIKISSSSSIIIKIIISDMILIILSSSRCIFRIIESSFFGVL